MKKDGANQGREFMKCFDCDKFIGWCDEEDNGGGGKRGRSSGGGGGSGGAKKKRTHR